MAGRLTAIKKKSDGSTIANYDYDYDGRRIRSNVNGTITNYVYDGDSIRVLYETNASNQITRYYSYNKGRGWKHSSFKIYPNHNNHGIHWQKNKWSYYKGKYTRSSKGTKRWTWWGKRIRDR
ncbi:hypothetical protein IC620_01540 [Hazenella sp. IB182357]|uniref:Uncharacterized protein n=1 Tax=Polycladospora coralii TaxID=2771432 RepID=A0A926RT92_9BACL|nr:hypothetical protein [Polycladospora coralii]MBD1371042.1 hypothetical protein [Polycladospora coralii]